MHKKKKFLLLPEEKKGESEKYLSIYWLMILVIIAMGISGMVYVYYGTPYDVRELESSILTNKIADCVSYAGRINNIFISQGKVQFSGDGNNFLEECHLNFSSTEEEIQYYARINLYSLSDLSNPILNISTGNTNYLLYCEIQEDKRDETLPACLKSSFYSLDDSGNKYIIQIISAVNKGDKNGRK